MSASVPDPDWVQRLSRQLWFRGSGQRYRFVLQPADPAGLALEPVGGGAAAAAGAPVSEAYAALPERQRGEAVVGAVLVGAQARLTFCSAADPDALLRRLGAWCRQAAPFAPAVAGLIDAGAATAAFDWRSDAAIRALDPASLTVRHDPAAWRSILRADAAQLAAALTGRYPGERLWYWLGLDAEQSRPLPPVLLPVASDPNRDRMNYLIGTVEPNATGGRASGICYVTDDGRVDFVGPDLERAYLESLAAWTRKRAAAAPALARLADCRLVRTVGAQVAEIIDDAALWRGLTRPPAPATMAETRAILTGLRPGEEYWFWLTGACPDGGFLTLAGVADDPEGVAFVARVQGLYRRFERAFTDAVSGVARVTGERGLLFVSATADVGTGPDTMRRLGVLLQEAGVALGSAPLIDANGRRMTDARPLGDAGARREGL